MARALPTEHHVTRDLDEHMALLRRQINRSVEDSDLRQLAVKLVSGRHEWTENPRSGRRVPTIRAFGCDFEVPDRDMCAPRDEKCEIEMIWDFFVLNVRYVYDPDEIDFFAVTRATLEAGGGDCDDLTIGIISFGKLLGFKGVARVISTTDDPDEWTHVYPMLGIDTKDNPDAWVPMDTTVTGSVPGWQFPDIANIADYPMWGPT